MIEARYTLSDDPAIVRDQLRINLQKADLVDLCYSCFGGDLTLKVSGLDLSIITGGGVQILDFAVEFYSAGRAIASGKIYRISFAGMADEIYATPDGDQVKVACNYATGSSQVPGAEFISAGRNFLSTVLADLMARYPELRKNGDIRRACSWVGLTS
ncbi:hypothetical protein GA0115240_135262 [Streptomyces sp. DvalAA-14]|nr:hypothetical protein GA0115240_135262 [Streptomyces sp. DvalAA-14]